MAWDINRVVLVGRLTADIELKHGNSGSAFAKTSLAVCGKEKEAVSFFDCVIFGKTAEAAAQYAGKGSLICIEGALSQSRWETQDGQKRSRVEILVDRLQFLNTGEKHGKSPSEMPEDSYGDDYAPF